MRPILSCCLGVGIELFFVDDKGRVDGAGKEIEHVLHRRNGHPLGALSRQAGDVRRQDDLIEPEQGVIGKRRFVIEDIETGGRNPSLAQCLQQGRLVNHASARSIDDNCGGFHCREFPGTDRRAGGLGHMHRYGVGPAQSDGKVIGHVSLRYTDATAAQAEVRFAVAPVYRNTGYGTEAVKAVLTLGFEKFKFHRIFARTAGKNEASARLLKDLGMRLEAHYREHALFQGEWDEELHFAILDRECQRGSKVREITRHKVA